MKTKTLIVLNVIFLLSDISLAQTNRQGCAGYRLQPAGTCTNSYFGCITDTTINEGDTVKFEVGFHRLHCGQPYKYEWFSDSVLIPDSDSLAYFATLPGLYTAMIYGGDFPPSFHAINLIVTDTTGIGQNYYPMPKDSATWTVVQYIYPISLPIVETRTFNYGLSGDTTIEGKLFSKMYLNSSPLDTTIPKQCFNHQTAQYVAAIWEDSTKKVWVRSVGDTADLLYYDFALSAGDTFCFPMSQPASGNNCFEVNAVDSILIDGNYRKQIHFQDVGGNEQWIEGIGSATGWFSEWSYFGNFDFNLECYSENQKLIYGDSSFCSCLRTGITGPDKEEGIKIYPNPTTSRLIVETPNWNGRKLVEIYSMLGQKVKSLIMENYVLTIDVSNLAGAEVFLVVVNDDGHHWTKIIMKNAP